MHKKTTKKLKSLMLIVFSIIVIGNAQIAVAATDVTTNHWANSQIESVVSRGIMPVFSGNLFKPDLVVTNIETIISLYRSVKAADLIDNVQMEIIKSKYEAALKALNIPQILTPYAADSYYALAFALEHNVLTLDEIKVFVSGTALTNVKKVNAVVLTAKILNVYKQENLNRIILLSYKDSAEISLSAIKYVNFLIENGIISSKGDNYGKFNPNGTLNRATLSILADGLYKSLIIGKTTESTPAENSPVSIEATKIFSGLVKTLNDSERTISVMNASGKTEFFSLGDAGITAAGINGTFNNITLNAQIELTIKDGGVTIAALEKAINVVEGNFILLTDYFGVSSQRKSIKISLPSDSYDYKFVYDDTLVTIDGVPAKATDIKLGYKLIILFEGFDAKRIIAYSDNYVFYGILKNDFVPNIPGKFEAIQESGNIYSTVTQSVITTSNNTAQEFKAGDIVKVTLKYGELSNLEYVGQARTVIGKLSGINIKLIPELTITPSALKDETYPLSNNVKILDESGERLLSIYDLRLNQEVTINIGIGGITKVQLGR